MQEVDICLYHGANCRDGYCSFWLVKKAFPDAVGYPTNYGDPLPDESVYAGKSVVICDFSYPPDQMAVLAVKAKAVVTLDHHISAVRKWDAELDHGPSMTFHDETWRPNVSMLFDTRKSGAVLTWEWLQSIGADPDPEASRAPWLVRYVQDRDIWAWELPESKAVNAYVASRPMTVEAWDRLYELMEQVDSSGQSVGMAKVAEMGRLLLERDGEYVGRVVENAVYWPLADGVSVPVLNTTHLHSEVGNALCQGHPFSLTYFDDLKAMKRRWSLRSADGGMDVSKVAECLGGGGHARASGFERSLDETFSATAWLVGQAYKQVKSGKQPGGE